MDDTVDASIREVLSRLDAALLEQRRKDCRHRGVDEVGTDHVDADAEVRGLRADGAEDPAGRVLGGRVGCVGIVHWRDGG